MPSTMPAFAFVFPGQGSQSVGMLDAWGDHPAVRRTLEEASSALDEAVRGGKIRCGDTVLLEGVGGGFTWGAVLLDL